MPRAGLSSEVVVAEAADVADEVGHDALTLAALAARFGVAVPSLYKHVAGLDDLRRRLALRSVRELGERLAAVTADADDGDAFREMARAYRAYARGHPGRYAATVRAPGPDDDEHRRATDAVLATVLEVLAAHGVRGDEAIDAARTVRAALHGFVALEDAGGFGLPRDVERSFERMIEALETALRAWSPPAA